MHNRISAVFVFTLISVGLAHAGSAATKVVLHNFATPPKGANPHAGLLAAAGNLYGTTSTGGASGFGTVYEIDPSGRVKVLHSFTGGTDGASPLAGVICDGTGNLYGTTSGGGPSIYGTVYKIDPTGKETILYSFTGIVSPAGQMEPIPMRE